VIDSQLKIMGLVCEKVLLAAGISKSPGAVDWASDGTIVFGAGASVALMQHRSTGIDLMLTGHGDRVNAVRTFEYEGVGGRGLVSGSTDKTAKVWTQIGSEWRCVVRILRGLGRVGCACALRVVRAHTQHTHTHTTHVLGCRPPPHAPHTPHPHSTHSSQTLHIYRYGSLSHPTTRCTLSSPSATALATAHPAIYHAMQTSSALTTPVPPSLMHKHTHTLTLVPVFLPRLPGTRQASTVLRS
jgi:WD40 repeat protein